MCAASTGRLSPWPGINRLLCHDVICWSVCWWHTFVYTRKHARRQEAGPPPSPFRHAAKEQQFKENKKNEKKGQWPLKLFGGPAQRDMLGAQEFVWNFQSFFQHKMFETSDCNLMSFIMLFFRAFLQRKTRTLSATAHNYAILLCQSFWKYQRVKNLTYYRGFRLVL